MAMETRLSLRQSQRVVMTPLLQQAIQLLQLSTLELQEVVQRELLENPLLEETPESPEAGPGEAPGAGHGAGQRRRRRPATSRRSTSGAARSCPSTSPP